MRHASFGFRRIPPARPRRRLAVALVSLFLLLGPLPGAGQVGLAAAPTAQDRPFILPFNTPPGPDTWLLSQPYGNTTFAYQNRRSIYSAGEGLHFGVDFDARCGTPVVAIGDGVVVVVDNPYHGAPPHNLMIDHPNGYASFYGHLLTRPNLKLGQQVKAGEVVALTGDPDRTCVSRPHLHLEIRNVPGHRIGYDPMTLIDADWDQIALVGSTAQTFQQNLDDPLRWQSLLDQPNVIFGGPLLNDYASTWPPPRW
jgi:murein DD-endopeptidase MepM/ murein hydrolase activator NlpD